jgi:Flp pilus assembly pilin Flp
MQMLSRLVQDQSHNAVVEYALIAMLVAATVILRVTMQA